MQAPPKFSSFRPKAAATSSPVVPSDALKDTHSPLSHNLHTRRRDDHHNSSSRTSTAKALAGVRSLSSASYEESDNSLFIIDRRGDRDNETYGTNNKYAIPVYWPVTNRKILGDRHSSSGNFGPKARPLSSLTRQDRQVLGREAKYVSPASSLTEGNDELLNRDFVSLKAGTKSKRQRILGELPVLETERKRLAAERSQDSDDDSSMGKSSSDSESEESQELLRLKEKSARLSSRVKTEPENVQAWQEYIAYQDVWVEQGDYADDNALVRHRHTAPVKLSIYEKALCSVRKDDPGRERLLIGMMTQAELVLESHKLASKWHQVAQENQKFEGLWLAYLNFVESNFTHFKLEICRETFGQYLRTLRDTNKSTGHQIHVFSRMAALLADAGYQELAIALWQAAFEFNCFRPSSIEVADASAAFAVFWDDELPRIGDLNGSGWCNENGTTVEIPTAQGSRGKGQNQFPRDRLRQWFAKETGAMAEFTLPGRSIDDAAAEDPFHVVFFSDIQAFLLVTPSEVRPTTLVDAFVAFFHLPPLPKDRYHDTAEPTKLPMDSFLRNETPWFRSADQKHNHADSDDYSLKAEDLDQIIQYYLTTTNALFNTDQSSYMRNSVRRLSVEKCLFVGRTLQTLANKYTSWDSLAEYSIAFQMHAGTPSLAQKYARKLLKTRSSNLRLYNAYGLLEARLGNKDASDKVFSTAIGMSITLEAEARRDVVLLWRIWVWEALTAGNTATAVQRLLSCGKHHATAVGLQGSPNINPEVLYETEAHLIAGITFALSSSHHDHVAYYIDLLALLHYLTSDPTSVSLPAALRSYTTSLARLSTPTSTISNTSTTTTSLALELTHQSRAHLLNHHLHYSLPYQPSSIRAALAESISLFPSNTVFLSLYRANEKRHRADDRVRDIVRNLLQTPAAVFTTESSDNNKGKQDNDNDNIFTHAFAISTELHRGALLGSTAHSVRAAFSRATTASRTCRHSATIWSAWLAYERSLLDAVALAETTTTNQSRSQIHHPPKDSEKMRKQKTMVRDVFFQGLRCLPWNKRFAMEAGDLWDAGVIEEGECRGVVEGVVGRGLRVYGEVEVEGVLDVVEG